jgi:hypothetical protein
MKVAGFINIKMRSVMALAITTGLVIVVIAGIVSTKLIKPKIIPE